MLCLALTGVAPACVDVIGITILITMNFCILLASIDAVVAMALRPYGLGPSNLLVIVITSSVLAVAVIRAVVNNVLLAASPLLPSHPLWCRLHATSCSGNGCMQ